MRRYTEVAQLYFDAWSAQQRAVPIPIDNTTQGKRVNQERQTMVSRIYVEKKPSFDVEAQQLLAELRTILGWAASSAFAS
jgi:hypothetical protein